MLSNTHSKKLDFKLTTYKYDVGILGWWYGKNYGSIFTYYGLNRALEGLGYKVLMVHEPTGYNGYRVQWPNDILSIEFARRMGYNFTEQAHYSKLPELNNQVKSFVVGSDQLWNPRIGRVNDDLFLDFAGPNNGRVAYATSFGNRGIAKFEKSFIEKHQLNLQRFAGISVREDYAIDIAKKVFNVDAVQVVDPVFLLPFDHYLTLAEKATYQPSGDYLAVFYLDATEKKKNVSLALAKKLGLEKIVVIPNPDGGRQLASELFADPRFELLDKDSPENFLKTYSQASYVVTDSFHGSAFAAIFGKPFSSIYNTHRGADRFKSLMSSLGFGDTRRVYESDTDETIGANSNVSFDINFGAANNYILDGREKAMAWLKATLEKTPEWPEQSATLDADNEGHTGEITHNPRFESNNSTWKITPSQTGSKLSIEPNDAIRGNLVWCDLPDEIVKGSAYRLTIKWKVKTTGSIVNLHIRNPITEKFVTVGAVNTKGISIAGRTFGAGGFSLWGRTIKPKNISIGNRTDTVEFIVRQDGYTQFMLGAVHFSGLGAGAKVESIALQKVATSKVSPSQKNSTHAEVSYALAMNDNKRFALAHSKSVASRDIGAWRARMMFHAHAIEKGLSHTQFKSGFGKISVPALAKEMNSWLTIGHDAQDQFFRTSASVMNTYFERHKALNVDVSGFWKMYNADVQAVINAANNSEGGVLAAGSVRESVVETAGDRNFLDVLYARRSVREFTAQPVFQEEIARAVQIAMQAPSVCNRQAARVHQIDDPRLIKAALKIQGGISGYEPPPKLLLVTSDLRAFLFAAERNQPFVDGGLFMMTLLLGLTQIGLGSCSLNTAMGTERENQIRKILKIPEHEVFISFIAVGHYDPEVLVPKSRRIGVDDVIIRHVSNK